ncbi:hypothetical protein PFUGPA_03667 [Plasmodium falciparum Palo Alto/Uganda]|uniref:Uncharacterized protein n=1 Tax=Plasmodium falciparum (isolate Palo Alto / Uganda) TaxID=57270 RepID=W4IUM6_PLAFP|nr:hypothetical protein PFUGPA_03667 [Plasmodium falciparum Palo Alto/Uganda]
MNVQKIVTFCFAISYLLYCHIIWNGCYNIYSSSEDEVYNLLYYRKKAPKTVKLEIRNKLKIKDIQKVYVKKTPCPVLPRPIRSLLWDGVIKPIFKILYMGISVYLIIRFSVLFLPYTKSYFSQENYSYLSSFILHSYNLITKISKEFGNVFNKVIQENSVVEKEL